MILFSPLCWKVEKDTLDRLRAHLRKLREIHTLSQEEVAHLAGIDYKFYQSIEAGRRKELRVSTVERLARGLRVGSLSVAVAQAA